MRGVYIKCTPGSTIAEREDIINGLKSFVRDSRAVITNMKDILESMDFATFVLDLFFNIVATIIVIMCFFMLIISFTSNITENAWEFGVLRALGLTVCWGRREEVLSGRR
jgi:ABC-type antimicrobial peptide transport system permease subunit